MPTNPYSAVSLWVVRHIEIQTPFMSVLFLTAATIRQGVRERVIQHSMSPWAHPNAQPHGIMDPGLRKLGASCCRSDGRSRLGVREGVGWWVGRDRGAYGLCAPLEWEAEVNVEAVVVVVGRWWRRLAVRVNGSRGLGGWAGFFLALPVFWTSWSWEDGRTEGGEADACSGEIHPLNCWQLKIMPF